MIMAVIEIIHEVVGSENMRMKQLARPRQGIRGKRGALNVFRFGVFFLSLIADECRIMWVVSIEKLVIAAAVLRSDTNARMVINAPVMRMETYGVPSFGWTFANARGNCPFLAIANETLDRPSRFVRSTLTRATSAPKETIAKSG